MRRALQAAKSEYRHDLDFNENSNINFFCNYGILVTCVFYTFCESQWEFSMYQVQEDLCGCRTAPLFGPSSFLLRAYMNGIPIDSYRDISNICWTILISSSMMLNECTKVFLGVAGMRLFPFALH